MDTDLLNSEFPKDEYLIKFGRAFFVVAELELILKFAIFEMISAYSLPLVSNLGRLTTGEVSDVFLNYLKRSMDPSLRKLAKPFSLRLSKVLSERNALAHGMPIGFPPNSNDGLTFFRAKGDKSYWLTEAIIEELISNAILARDEIEQHVVFHIFQTQNYTTRAYSFTDGSILEIDFLDFQGEDKHGSNQGTEGGELRKALPTHQGIPGNPATEPLH